MSSSTASSRRVGSPKPVKTTSLRPSSPAAWTAAQTASRSGFPLSRRSKPPTLKSSSLIFGQKTQASVQALVTLR